MADSARTEHPRNFPFACASSGVDHIGRRTYVSRGFCLPKRKVLSSRAVEESNNRRTESKSRRTAEPMNRLLAPGCRSQSSCLLCDPLTFALRYHPNPGAEGRPSAALRPACRDARGAGRSSWFVAAYREYASLSGLRAQRRLAEKGFVTGFRMRPGCKEISARPPQMCLLHIEDGLVRPDAVNQDAAGIAVQVHSRRASKHPAVLRPPEPKVASAALSPQVGSIQGGLAARLAEGVRKRLPSPPLHGGEGRGEGDDPVHRHRFTPHPDLLPSSRGEGIGYTISVKEPRGNTLPDLCTRVLGVRGRGQRDLLGAGPGSPILDIPPSTFYVG